MDWRTAIYPLGFVAAFAFTLRFFIQWLESESKGQSIVSPKFWKISLFANSVMAVHTLIQVQYPLCLIQGINGVISWRNLNLQQSEPKSLKTVITLFGLVNGLITLAFILQGLLVFDHIDFVRTPISPWSIGSQEPSSAFWPLLGFMGAALFSGRFWIQWWSSEKTKTSVIGAHFWWISLIGASTALIYFLHIRDWVNIAGYGLGIIPYARNLFLLNK